MSTSHDNAPWAVRVQYEAQVDEHIRRLILEGDEAMARRIYGGFRVDCVRHEIRREIEVQW